MKVVKSLMFILFVLCSLSGKAQEVTADSTGYIVRVGEMAPNFTITLTDGKKVTLSELRGKVVMLQFTASWCGVCRKEMPFIEKDIWLKHKDNSAFALIGIDRDNCVRQVDWHYLSLGLRPRCRYFCQICASQCRNYPQCTD